MKRVVVAGAIAAAFVAGLIGFAVKGAVTLPLACPSGSVFVESRAWGTPAGVSFDEYQGIDEGTCLPTGSVSGTVSFPLHIGLRHNPVTIDQIRVYVADAAHGSGVLGYDSGTGHNFVTGVTDGNREADITIPVNVGILGSGWKELRFQARVHRSAFPAGQLSFATTGWQVRVNGGTSTYRTLPWTEVRSWWGDAGPYVHSRFLSDLPITPISGVWPFTVAYPDGHGSTTVDTDSHADPMVIGPDLHCTSSCSLDTRTLADGTHFLFLRSDAAIAGGTSSSIEVIGFTVTNGRPVPTPTATPTATPSPTPTPVVTPSPAPSTCGG
jgi:hypothetical protein